MKHRLRPDEDQSLAAARRLVAARAARRSTLASTLLLLASSAGGLAVGVLWWTEPRALPLRTQVGFALCMGVCGCWSGIAVWRLRRRGGFLARQRVFATGFALVASLAFTALGLAASPHVGAPRAAWTVGLSGTAMTAVAGALHAAARRRMRALEEELGRGG